MSQEQLEILQRALKREKAARKAAEKILEEKSRELYETSLKIKGLLDEKSSQLQGVFENIVDAYVVINLEGNVLKFNEAATNLFGYKIEEETINVVDLIYKEDYKYAITSFTDLQTKGFFKNYEARVYTKTKGVRWVHINASVIFDKNKNPVAAQGIVRDITVQNKLRKSLEIEKQKYYNIISNMNLGLVEVDLEDRILMTNQSFVNMTGYSKEELIGYKGKDFLPINEDIDLSIKKLQERKKDKIESYELRIKNKKGELRYWLVSGAPNFDLEGNVLGSIGINFDITELKNLQLQKESLLKKLEKSNDELQEYAHIVSHDLKSPLRSINALVSWIKEDNTGKLDDVSMRNFDLIDTTLEKMEQLISDILNYSSVGVNDSKKLNVNLNFIVKDLIKILYIPDHIEIKIQNNLPIVIGDKTKLQQVFQNLISNAVKFIDKDKGLIEIDFKDHKNYYQFSIKDNGIGIEEKYHNKIFKIFHSLNINKESTGIGLSIVKKIVNLHGGEIWLESKPTIGTIFYFTIKR
jgi:PAS domain S-box-containing protein